MKVASLEIDLLANIARLQQDMNRAVGTVGKSMGEIERIVQQTKNVLGSLGLGVGFAAMIGQVTGLTDAWGQVNSRLKIAVTGTQEFAGAQKELMRIANLTYSSYDKLAGGFANSTRSLTQLNVSMADQLKVQEALLSGSIVSGANDEKRARIQEAFNKALAQGKLRGDEWNTISQDGSRIVGLLADKLKMTELQVANLARNGGIEIKTFLDALSEGAAKVSKEVELMPVSFADIGVKMRNEFLAFFGTLDDTAGASAHLTGILNILADNLGLVIGAVATLAAARLSQWLAAAGLGFAQKTLQARASAVAVLDAAKADVVAKAAAAQVATARVAELRAAIAAADGNTKLALTTNGLIPAQARAAQASAAHTAALAAQATAASGASVAGGVMRGAMALLGGPVGVLTTAVIGGYMAWNAYKESADKTAQALTDMGEPIDQVIAKFQKLTLIEQGRALEGLAKAADEAKATLQSTFADMESVPLKLRVSPDFATFKAEMKALSESGSGVEEIDKRVKQLTDGLLSSVPAARSSRAAVEEMGIAVVAAARASAELQARQGALAPKLSDAADQARKLALEAANAAMGLSPEKWTEYLKKVETAASAVGMSAQQLAVHAAEAAGASASQAKLAGVLAASEAAAKALEKAIVDKDAKAKSGADALLGSLVAQEVQLRVNIAQASAYAALLAMGLSVESALQGSQTEGELVGLVELERVLKRVASVRENIATNTVAASSKAKKAMSEEAKLAKQFAEDRKKALETQYSEISALQDRAQLAEDEVATFGKSKSALESLTIARLEEQRTVLQGFEGSEEQVALINKEIEARRRLMQATARKDTMDATKKAADESKEVWKKTVDEYDRVFRDGFADMLNAGGDGWKSFTKSLVTTFKTSVADQIYKMFARPFVMNIIGNLAGVIGGNSLLSTAAGAAGASNAAGGALGLVGVTKNVYGAITSGFAGISSSVANGVQSGMNFFAGSGGFAGQGPMQISAFAQGVGTAAGILAGAGIGVAGGNLISGGYSAIGNSGNSAVYGSTALGAAVGSIVPVLGTALGAAVGGLLGGAVNRLFGSKPREYGDPTINGQFGGTSFVGQTATPWKQKGGIFSSSKRGVQYGALDREFAESMGSAFALIKTGAAGLAESVGVSASVLDTYTKSISVTLKGTAEENQAQIDALMDSIGEELVAKLVPNIGAFSKAGETGTQTLDRLSSSLTTANSWLTMLRQRLLNVSLAGADSASKLADVFGGLEALGQAAQAYYQVAYSEGERAALSFENINKALASVNVSMPSTMVELRRMVEVLDLNTDSGRAAYAALLAVAPEFASSTEAVKRAAQATAADLVSSFTGMRGQIVPALDSMQLQSALLGNTLVSTYTASGNVSRLFLDVNSGLITFGSKTGELTGGLTSAQQASVLLNGQILTLRSNSDAAKINIAGLGAALAGVNTETFVAAITLVFEKLATRISSVIDSISAERVAVREAALQIINPTVMSKAAIERAIAQVNTGLPSNAGVVAADRALASADARVVARQSEQNAKNASLQSAYQAQANINDATWARLSAAQNSVVAMYGARADIRRAFSLEELLSGSVAPGTHVPKKFASDLNPTEDLRRVLQAQLDARNVQATQNAAVQNRVNQALDQYNKSVEATTAAQNAANAAATNAKNAQTQYVDALQNFAIDASKNVTKLSKLREETVKYYETQKQLAELMNSSASALRGTVDNYRFSQMSSAQQFDKLQSDYAKAYALAVSTDGEELAGYGTQMNGMLNQLLEAARNNFASDAQYKAFADTAIARAEAVATRLENRAPKSYEADSLALLGQIDTTLAALDASSRSAEQLIVAAINVGRDATVNGLRQVTAALTGRPVAAFAAGGTHQGGLRLVGEYGPELEVTGPSRIYNAGQTRSMLTAAGNGGGNAEVAAEIRALRAENRNMSAELRAIAVSNNKMARTLEKFERGGIGVFTEEGESLAVVMNEEETA